MPKFVNQIIDSAEQGIGQEVKRSSIPTGTAGVCLIEENSEGSKTIMESEYYLVVGTYLYYHETATATPPSKKGSSQIPGWDDTPCH
jgi:hypothetical protein